MFWLALSIFLVAVSLTAVLIALLPAVQALARAARSVEKLADTLSREFPPTLEAIRLTGMEISELTEDVSEGVQSKSIKLLAAPKSKPKKYKLQLAMSLLGSKLLGKL